MTFGSDPNRPRTDRLAARRNRLATAKRIASSTHRSALAVTDGCGFILFTCLVSCLLMIINGGLVAAGYQWLADLGPKFLRQSRVAQATLFIAPVLLLFVQWWVLDHLLDFLRPRRRER